MLIFVLICVMSLSVFGEIWDVWGAIPKPAKIVIGIYLLTWSYQWFFDPIVIEVSAGLRFAAGQWGPFIIMNKDYMELPVYNSDLERYIYNHEYTHYIQRAFFGPLFDISYIAAYCYSMITTGDYAANNFWELQAGRAPADYALWKPKLIIDLSEIIDLSN